MRSPLATGTAGHRDTRAPRHTPLMRTSLAHAAHTTHYATCTPPLVCSCIMFASPHTCEQARRLPRFSLTSPFFFLSPHRYFKDRWNLFDLAVAVGGVVAMAGGSGPNVGLSLARLVRLVQVFKLAYRMPLLQLVIEALLYGCRSMVWVALLFGLFNYLFAIIGCLVFRDNDPFYFGGLRRSLITLWLVETLQNWEQPM